MTPDSTTTITERSSGPKATAERPAWWPTPTSAAATAVMVANGRVNTRPEIEVRRLLHARGLRYRVDMTIRYGATWTRPDVVFTRRRVAVYVDGCFWHGCPVHYVRPVGNRGYWSEKVSRNRRRDARATAGLEEMGWCVVRLWEHTPPGLAASLVATAYASRA